MILHLLRLVAAASRRVHRRGWGHASMVVRWRRMRLPTRKRRSHRCVGRLRVGGYWWVRALHLPGRADAPRLRPQTTHHRRSSRMPTLVTHQVSQRHHWIDMAACPMHPGLFQAGFDHHLVGALDTATPNWPSRGPKGRVIEQIYPLRQVPLMLLHGHCRRCMCVLQPTSPPEYRSHLVLGYRLSYAFPRCVWEIIPPFLVARKTLHLTRILTNGEAVTDRPGYRRNAGNCNGKADITSSTNRETTWEHDLACATIRHNHGNITNPLEIRVCNVL